MRSASALAALICAISLSAAAETFELRVRAYCPSPNCGFPSYAAYQARVLDAVQEMNLEWEPADISFRPVVYPPIADGNFDQLQGCTLSSQKALRQQFRDQVAAFDVGKISLMLTQNQNTCCTDPPDAPYSPPLPNNDTPTGILGIFCDPASSAFDSGTVWAHEMGHYFCLRHTMSFGDLADLLGSGDPVDLNTYNDLDTCCGVNDTPPDPGALENKLGAAGSDTDAGGNLINGHEWCEQSVDPTPPDPGSPHTSTCSTDCFAQAQGATVDTVFQPLARASMSYWTSVCKGPYVVGSVRYEAYTPHSLAQIAMCRSSVRTTLVDVCSGPAGGDPDHDGICHDVDNCPATKNTQQLDAGDSDGIGDACDLCPTTAGANTDTDGDQSGDVCDMDDDGDTCLDGVDQHPLEGYPVVGSIHHQVCADSIEYVTAFEGGDADMDGVLNCADLDDDGDLICDEGGPLDPNLPKGIPTGCVPGLSEVDDCPLVAGTSCQVEGAPADCEPDWSCLGGGCIEFLLKVVDAINPDPATDVVFERFRTANRKIFVAPLLGKTLGESANALMGGFAVAGFAQVGATKPAAPDAAAPLALGDRVRLEVWRRSPPERVAVIGEFDRSQVVLGDVIHGAILVVTPPRGGSATWAIAASWGFGHEPLAPIPDSDGDGIPDSHDDCVTTPNPSQRDADGDRFGDACDADLDQDGIVSSQDVGTVAGCIGADLRLHVPISEPSDPDEGVGGLEQPGPPQAAVDRAIRCAAMDLDGSGRVDAADVAIARLGGAPGPSARASVDLDADGILDGADRCPTVADPTQGDGDGDGAGNACDNCPLLANPRRALPIPAWMTLTGGQRDSDADGRGDGCDFDYDGVGPVVIAADFNQMKASVAHLVSASDCGTSRNLRCAIFDHDEAGPVITATDFNRAKAQVGAILPPLCPACGDFSRLPCFGAACPTP